MDNFRKFNLNLVLAENLTHIGLFMHTLSLLLPHNDVMYIYQEFHECCYREQ